MLRDKVKLHDVKDAEGFVIHNMRRLRFSVPPDETEDFIAEGLLVLCEMARKFDPERGARFSTYAIGFWPQKMGDAWHRMHPEHVLTTQKDGTRKYEYHAKPGSLELGMERDASIGNTDRLRIVGDFVSA